MTCIGLRTGFDAVAPQWDALIARQDEPNLFLTPAWQRTWWEHFRGDADLCLLTVGSESDPLGVAPMTLDGDVLRFLGGTDLFDYHDFVTDDPRFYDALADCLDGEPWRTMDLTSVPDGSPTLQHIPRVYRSRGCEVTVETEDVVPGLDLPGTWDDYLGGLRRKDRHELRRKLRRLDAAGSYRVRLSTDETLEADAALFHEVMRESREEKRDFLGPEREGFFRDIVERMQSAGFLRLLLLELDGEPIAAVLAFDYAGRRLLYNSGFRRASASLSAGFLLKALCVKDAIERRLTYFDFLRGAEPYKYHLGARDASVHRIVVRR